MTQASEIGAKLELVVIEVRRLEEENAQLRLERDQARAALVPFLEQVEKLREGIVAQLPKKDARLPSARTSYAVTTGMVDRWAQQYEGGMSLTKIAQEAGTYPDTVRTHLRKRGVETKGKRAFGHKPALSMVEKQGEPVPRCKECNLPLDSPALTNSNVPAPKDGVCGLCQFIANDLAEKRAVREQAA